MSIAKQALTTAAAVKVLNKEDKNVSAPNSNPSTFKEAFLARPLLWLAVGGVGAYVIYRVVKGAGKAIATGKGEAGEKKQDVKQFEKQMTPSYPDGAYFGFADSIYAARHGNNLWGTDEDAIYAVFRKMNNDLDVAKLTQAFGTKRLSFSFQSAGLGGYLSDEMDDAEIDVINKVLAAKNIVYRF